MDITVENTITITPRITANPPVLQDIEVTENGEYKADGSADGLGTVTVNVEPNNEEITVTENGEYTPSEEFDGISKVTVDVQPQINLETLNVDENGTYTPQTGFDGFGEVNVNIPAPVLDDINITENGEYNPVNDGFSKVTVDIPDPILDDINITENGNYVSEHDGFNNVTVAVPDKPLETKNITENGTYTPSQGKYGFSKVNVAVPDKPLETKNITENGSYSPSQGIYGFSQVTVDVQPDNEEINIVQNGIYTPSANKDGFSKVNVAVPDKPLEIKNIISNGQYTPSSGYYGFSEVNVNVQPNLEEKTITENGTYTPSSGYYGIGKVNVSVDDSIQITASYSNGIISWNVDSEFSDIYSNVFVNNINIYNGQEKSCKMSQGVSGNNLIKISTFDKTKLKVGCLSFIENISGSFLKIELESNQTLTSLKFNNEEVTYSDNMLISPSVTDIDITVSKIDTEYIDKGTQEIKYKDFNYTFNSNEVGSLYTIKPYNQPILTQDDLINDNLFSTPDNAFLVQSDSKYSLSGLNIALAFDNIKSSSNEWVSARSNFPHWIMINTTESICIKSFSLYPRQDYLSEIWKDFSLQYSNDGTEWNTIKELTNDNNNSSEKFFDVSLNTIYAKYHRLLIESEFGTDSVTSLGEFTFTALRQ